MKSIFLIIIYLLKIFIIFNLVPKKKSLTPLLKIREQKNQFVLIYNYLSITLVILFCFLFFVFVFLFFFFIFHNILCWYHTKISHQLRIQSFQNYINVKCHCHPLGHSLSHVIVSYRYFNSEFYIEGVCSDIPLVRLVQKGLFNFGKEKRHDILVNNSRDAH